MGGKGPCLGVQDPDSPRRLSKHTQCSERTPLDPHIHALFVPLTSVRPLMPRHQQGDVSPTGGVFGRDTDLYIANP